MYTRLFLVPIPCSDSSHLLSDHRHLSNSSEMRAPCNGAACLTRHLGRSCVHTEDTAVTLGLSFGNEAVTHIDWGQRHVPRPACEAAAAMRCEGQMSKRCQTHGHLPRIDWSFFPLCFQRNNAAVTAQLLGYLFQKRIGREQDW